MIRTLATLLWATSCCGLEWYAGWWAVRLESDVKASASIIFAAPLPEQSYVFVQPMLGLSGAGLYAGWGTDFEDHKWAGSHIRPKIGIVRTYNDPWLIEDDDW